MKKYIGTKQVEAEPMTMGEAHFKGLLQAGKVPSNQEEFDKPGYHVKHEEGCECWTPAEQFENEYQCSETYIDRMLIEATDLNLKAAKLGNFLSSEKHESLSDQKKNLLHAQYAAMASYSTILSERIRVEQEEQRKMNEQESIPDCGCTCGCDTADCGCTCGSGCNCQEGESSQAENAG